MKIESHFNNFINSEQMTGMKHKYKWICISLPGQEKKAKDLRIK